MNRKLQTLFQFKMLQMYSFEMYLQKNTRCQLICTDNEINNILQTNLLDLKVFTLIFLGKEILSFSIIKYL